MGLNQDQKEQRPLEATTGSSRAACGVRTASFSVGRAHCTGRSGKSRQVLLDSSKTLSTSVVKSSFKTQLCGCVAIKDCKQRPWAMD